ncbi:MAG: DUF4445 domain-containing protein [Deltaproteobacteria bacterium]|nr:DUF4445 domain-containing protein [Deltaproteobacteria bacterium]
MPENYRVTFEPMGLSVTADAGSTILEVAAGRDIPIRCDCGGTGLCGKCRIIAEPVESLSPLTESELELIPPHQMATSYRLACQTLIRGPLTVTIPAQLADSQEVRGKTGLSGSYPLDPLIERIVLPQDQIPVPGRGISSDLAAWVTDRAKGSAGREICFKDPHALRQLSLPEAIKGEITLVDHAQKGITAVLPGRRERSLGLALDLGTTTVAAYLCDLHTGEVLDAAASVNPQRRYGEDVISRISLANEKESGLESLRKLIVDSINYLISRLMDQVGASREDIDEVTAVGNTTMEQIFAGFHPNGLGVVPYMPAVRTPPDMKAVELGLDLNPGTNVHIFPVISGFVGGDTLGVILAERPHHRDEICLIVDIGTNGEVVLGNREGLWVTSCATGPALEGAQISCGIRAVSGAIHRVDIETSSCQINCQVLGEMASASPIGICGSGIIDAVAAMRRVGMLLPNGRFKEGMPGVVCDEQGIGRRVVLVAPEKSGTGIEISVTLQDIRQIQLAKAALAVGIEFLMRQLGITRIDRTILTGAFGASFDWRNAVTIGMLPCEVLSGEVLTLNNLAGVGSIIALLDKKPRAEAAELSRRIKFLELAQEPDFAVRFPESTAFPPLDSS